MTLSTVLSNRYLVVCHVNQEHDETCFPTDMISLLRPTMNLHRIVSETRNSSMRLCYSNHMRNRCQGLQYFLGLILIYVSSESYSFKICCEHFMM